MLQIQSFILPWWNWCNRNTGIQCVAKDADVVIAIGSRLSDFTTSSKHLFQNADVKFVTINNNRYHAYKMDAVKAVGDAKATVEALAEKLRAKGYVSGYKEK